MSVYLVTWDINKARANYTQARQNLIDHLKRYEHIKDEGLDSVWFIRSNLDANSVSADIRTKLNDNDRLIVTKLVSGQHQGWLASEIWEWINARI